MIGVTIGTGDWSGVAHAAASRMARMTGLQCYVLPEAYTVGYTHPSWAKVRAIEYARDDVLLFDADIWCMKPWSPEDILGDADMAGVPEQTNTINGVECKLYDLPPERYVNGGLLIMRRVPGAKLMAAVATYHPEYGRWLEQTALNVELMKLGNKVRHLPRAYNDLVPREAPLDPVQLRERHSINLHFAGPKTVESLTNMYANLP